MDDGVRRRIEHGEAAAGTRPRPGEMDVTTIRRDADMDTCSVRGRQVHVGERHQRRRIKHQNPIGPGQSPATRT